MKKLMVAFVAIATAVVANAASVKWSASGAYEMGSTTVKAGSSYTAYFVSSITIDGLAKGYSHDSAIADLQNQDASFLNTYGVTPMHFAADATTGAGKGSISLTEITANAANGQAWKGYLVILDSTDIASATYAFVTSEVSKSTGATGGQASLTFGSTALAGTQSAGNWYALAPEPTSGLMMLLGMGVLALRRRRA